MIPESRRSALFSSTRNRKRARGTGGGPLHSPKVMEGALGPCPAAGAEVIRPTCKASILRTRPTSWEGTLVRPEGGDRRSRGEPGPSSRTCSSRSNRPLIEEELDVKTLDRREVILDIFAGGRAPGRGSSRWRSPSCRPARAARGGRKELSGSVAGSEPGDRGERAREDRRRIRTQIPARAGADDGGAGRDRSIISGAGSRLPVGRAGRYTNAGKATLFNA